jgi:hypothetical protein
MLIKTSYPNILPLAGGIIGLAMGLSYYLSIMISQLFIGRPSSTWILGIFWLPIFLIKPVLIGILIGSIAWLIIRSFQLPRPLTPTEIKAFKIFLVLLVIVSAATGFIKIIKGGN